MFKKKDELNKENYRSASVLYHTPKISERKVLNQMNIFFQILIFTAINRISQIPQHTKFRTMYD